MLLPPRCEQVERRCGSRRRWSRNTQAPAACRAAHWARRPCGSSRVPTTRDHHRQAGRGRGRTGVGQLGGRVGGRRPARAPRRAAAPRSPGRRPREQPLDPQRSRRSSGAAGRGSAGRRRGRAACARSGPGRRRAPTPGRAGCCEATGPSAADGQQHRLVAQGAAGEQAAQRSRRGRPPATAPGQLLGRGPRAAGRLDHGCGGRGQVRLPGSEQPEHARACRSEAACARTASATVGGRRLGDHHDQLGGRVGVEQVERPQRRPGRRPPRTGRGRRPRGSARRRRRRRRAAPSGAGRRCPRRRRCRPAPGGPRWRSPSPTPPTTAVPQSGPITSTPARSARSLSATSCSSGTLSLKTMVSSPASTASTASANGVGPGGGDQRHRRVGPGGGRRPDRRRPGALPNRRCRSRGRLRERGVRVGECEPQGLLDSRRRRPAGRSATRPAPRSPSRRPGRG